MPQAPYELPPTRHSRTLAALLTLHAGDSLGSTHEFQTHTQIASSYPRGIPRTLVGGGVFDWAPGAATDDTDLTRAVLLAYHDVFVKRPHMKGGHGDVVLRSAERFVSWYTGDNWPGRKKGSRPVDVGGATAEGIENFMSGKNVQYCGAGKGKSGNGSLMRCLPTGLFQLHPQKIIDESMAISAITHNDRRCTISCAAYNVIISGLIQGYSADESVRRGEETALRLEGGTKGEETYWAIRQGRKTKLYDLARTGPDEHFKGGCSGYVLETLTLAVAAVLDKRKVEDVLVDVVRVGKDTDTNAAVAGGLLGARDGMEGLPMEWKRTVQHGEEFRRLTEELLQKLELDAL